MRHWTSTCAAIPGNWLRRSRPASFALGGVRFAALPPSNRLRSRLVSPRSSCRHGGAGKVGGTLAVAVFGALIAHRASFLPGMRASLLIAAVTLAVAAAAAFTLPQGSARGAARK